MGKTYIALDISTESVRFLEARFKRKNHIMIEDGGELIAPVLSNGEVENLDEIVDSLLDYLDIKNGKKTPITILLPSKTFMHNLSLTAVLEEKTLKKTMNAQMQHHFSTKEKQITNMSHVLDYGVYGTLEIDKARQLSLLMSALGKEVAVKCIDLVNKKNFRIRVIENPINNLFYVAETARQKKSPIDMVLQLQNYETNVLFLHKGKPTFQRFLKFGVQNMVKDQDVFFEQIFRTMEKYRQDNKVGVFNMLLVGVASNWWGVTGSFMDAFSKSDLDIEVSTWSLQAGETYENHRLKVTNTTDMELDSSYATTLGLLAREVF